jgi:hypothetical protein
MLLEQIQQQQTFAGNLPPQRSATGPPILAPAEGLRSFDYTGPTQGAYEEIARQFGLVVTFDADLVDREIRFRVSDVDFETTMNLIAHQTATFWTALDARSIFVAPDTLEKRRQYDPLVTVTLALPNSETVDQMTEASRLVREITGVRRSVLDTGSHTLTIRDTPENIELARLLLEEIEQPLGELMLDVHILEVNRDAARRVGITPPTQARVFSLGSAQARQLLEAQNSGTLLEVLQSIFGPLGQASAGAALSGLLPPLIAFGGGNTFFLATLPGASADFSRTVGLVRQADRLLLRLKEGQPGRFFLGERFPITLALLSESLIPVQTQFTPEALAGAFPRSDFSVGDGPAGLALADFDGDDDIDIAVANASENTVSILIGDGEGNFSEHTVFPAGTAPVALAAADVDRDGTMDLAVANNSVSILLGNGDGTFEPPVDLDGGTSPAAILLTDLDGDTIVDLAVATPAANAVSVIIGNGDGTFEARRNFAVGDNPVAIAAGDFDNDDNVDLAVANQASNTVSILTGSGDGTFLERGDVAAGAGPTAVVAADFDSDDQLDLAVANQSDDTVSILFGNGDGAFADSVDLNAGGSPTALVAADFSGDDSVDLVVVNQSDSNLSVFLTLPNRAFADPLTLAVGNAPVAAAAADLSGDDRFDLAVSNRDSDTVSVTLNRSTVPISPDAQLSSYPASEYVDLGLKMEATARMHPGDEVTLRLQFEITSLTGQDVNGIPVLGNRVIEQMVRLRENQSSVLSGIIQSSELRGIRGWPGTAHLPVLRSLTSVRETTESETELLIVITPRQLRLAPRSDRTFYAGRGEGPLPPPEPVTPAVPVPGEAPTQPGQPPPPGAPPGEPDPPGVPGQPPPPDELPAPGRPGQPLPAPGRPGQPPRAPGQLPFPTPRPPDGSAPLPRTGPG